MRTDLAAVRRAAEVAELARNRRWLPCGLDAASELASEVVGHPATSYIVMAVIIVNTAILGLDKYPLWDEAAASAFELINFAFTIFFTCEMLLKMLATGFRVYFQDKLNAFDCFVVMMSVIDVAMNPPGALSSEIQLAGTGHGGVATVFRMMRVFRIFRLARNWQSFARLLSTIIKTVKDLANFTLLLFIVIYVFALVGMQLFANRFRFDTRTRLAVENVTCGACPTIDIPRTNFDTLLYAIMTVFQSITTANWNNTCVCARVCCVCRWAVRQAAERARAGCMTHGGHEV